MKSTKIHLSIFTRIRRLLKKGHETDKSTQTANNEDIPFNSMKKEDYSEKMEIHSLPKYIYEHIIEIKGIRYYAENLRSGDYEFTLKIELHNPYDAYAIAVHINNGVKIGYLACGQKDLHAILSKRGSEWICNGRIFQDRGKTNWYGWVDIKIT